MAASAPSRFDEHGCDQGGARRIVGELTFGVGDFAIRGYSRRAEPDHVAALGGQVDVGARVLDRASLGFFRRAGWKPDGLVRTLDTGETTVREVRLTGTLALELIE
jgi:hypothetical protein